LSVGIFDNGDIKYHNKKLDYHSNLLSLIELDGGYYFNGLFCKYPQFSARPYLRSMSSMTEEERYELQDVLGKEVELLDDFIHIVDSSRKRFSLLELQAVFDWINAHHFDYRGLIPIGLAIEAPEGMYNDNRNVRSY
jgi:hypothetical protein